MTLSCPSRLVGDNFCPCGGVTEDYTPYTVAQLISNGLNLENELVCALGVTVSDVIEKGYMELNITDSSTTEDYPIDESNPFNDISISVTTVPNQTSTVVTAAAVNIFMTFSFFHLIYIQINAALMLSPNIICNNCANKRHKKIINGNKCISYCLFLGYDIMVHARIKISPV